jgi:spore coat protein U-like protein
MPVNASALRVCLAAAFAVLALWLLVAPQPAAANVGCNVSQTTLAFGGAQTAIDDVNYSCQNFGSSPRTFTLCLGVGTSSYPGTATQPAMQHTVNATPLNYSLYRDSGYSQIWNTANPITKTVTVPANQTLNGTITYYGKIVAGQNPPVGNYQGQLFNNRLGFINAGSCQTNVSDLAGVEFTANVSATVTAGCTMGTIGKIDFGSQPGLVKRADAAGSVALTCPVSVPWTLAFDGGNNLSAGVRRMKSIASYYVPYTIYRDANRSNAIAINGTITGNGTGAVQTTTIYGRVEPPTPPPVGTYQDFIVVTLSF